MIRNYWDRVFKHFIACFDVDNESNLINYNQKYARREYCVDCEELLRLGCLVVQGYDEKGTK